MLLRVRPACHHPSSVLLHDRCDEFSCVSNIFIIFITEMKMEFRNRDQHLSAASFELRRSRAERKRSDLCLARFHCSYRQQDMGASLCRPVKTPSQVSRPHRRHISQASNQKGSSCTVDGACHCPLQGYYHDRKTTPASLQASRHGSRIPRRVPPRIKAAATQKCK